MNSRERRKKEAQEFNDHRDLTKEYAQLRAKIHVLNRRLLPIMIVNGNASDLREEVSKLKKILSAMQSETA